MNDKKDAKKIPPFLRWPWSLLVYLLLIVLLRLWAIPAILLLTTWQKKNQPDGPEEGYCLQRTRRRLTHLLWAALLLVISAACGVTFFVRLQTDRALWETEDYLTLAVAGTLTVGAALLGLYEGYTSLRDALMPEKSRLATSIRSQLPYPDEAPGVRDLFGMVDQDIRENGQWFDRIAVGKEWVLGDEVSFIPRIRAVFGRDEIQRRHSGSRTTTTRIIELYILDDRRQVQISDLRDPNELPLLLECLKLRAPDALFLPYSQYLDYCGKSDEEWDALLLDYRRRKSERETKEAHAPQCPATAIPSAGSVPPPPAQKLPVAPARQTQPPHLVLVSREGVRQQHEAYTLEDIQVAADGLIDGSYRTVDVLLPGGSFWLRADAGDATDGRYTVRAARPDADKLRFFTTRCSHRQAAALLLEFAQGRLCPQGPDWRDYTREVERSAK